MLRLPAFRRALAALLVAAPWPALSAQMPAPVAAPADTSHHRTLLTPADALLGVGFVGLTIAMFPVDQSVARRLADENNEENRFLHRASTGVEVISIPGAYIIGTSMYAFGRLAHHPNVEDIGWHGTEAVVAASGTTAALKALLGRARPFVTADTNASDFRFFHGFSEERASFPSGHTAVAFAAASSVTSEMRRVWPGHTWFVAPVMYGGATMVGLSRMYHNKHWASDVALGAGIGTFIGLKTVRYSHLHPDNRIDRVILRTSVVPDGRGGGLLIVSAPLGH